jgi:small subunit ribosomal protein S4
MARYRESQCRLCRRENMKLFLKGERCYSEKCAMDRRPYPPGQHGQARQKLSEYGVQLREKQKVRRIYGILERQFRRYYQEAARLKGVTGELLLQLLERRLDNAIYRLGFAPSRAEARMRIRQGHVLVNGKRVDIPSFQLRVGMVLSLTEEARKVVHVLAAVENVEKRGVPGWLELDAKAFSGAVKALPGRDEITLLIQEQLIVELYSK